MAQGNEVTVRLIVSQMFLRLELLSAGQARILFGLKVSYPSSI